jgi:hypothetical protein
MTVKRKAAVRPTLVSIAVPYAEGESLTVTQPAASTPCGDHPAGEVGTRAVGAPIADHAAPLDTSGYLHIAGSDSSGGESISWELSRFPPALAFSRATYSVRENQATATITVTRGGDPRIPVSLHFSAAASTATAGSDFIATSGTLSFAAGETSKSFPVTILPDALPEGPETIALRLSAPSQGATLSTPRNARLTIGASDQQPDAMVSTSATAGFIGNNITTAPAPGKSRP